MFAPMTRDEIIARIRAHEPAIRAEGVAHLAIFGSRARGDHRPDSDLDVLIERQSPEEIAPRRLLAISGRLSEITGLDVSLVEHDQIEPGMRARMRDDLVEVF
jgi:predicted nucleotidyltransferase